MLGKQKPRVFFKPETFDLVKASLQSYRLPRGWFQHKRVILTLLMCVRYQARCMYYFFTFYFYFAKSKLLFLALQKNVVWGAGGGGGVVGPVLFMH